MAENDRTTKYVQDLSINPKYLALVPRPSPEEYVALKADIQLHGIEHPLYVTPEGIILDGHTRYQIAQELGIESVPITEREFKDPHEEELAVIRWNLKRRQLNDAQKIALIMVLEAQEGKEAKRRQEASQTTKGSKIGEHVKEQPVFKSKGRAASLAAKEYGMSREQYRQGKKIIEAIPDNPELAEAWEEAKAGKKKIYAVYRQLQFGTSQPDEEPHVTAYKKFTAVLGQVLALDAATIGEWPMEYQTKALHQIQQMRSRLRDVENHLDGATE